MLKKLAATFFLLGCLALHARPASATTCSIFYTWVNGDTITATRLNGNNNNFVTCGNAIDFNNIGSSGIKASNLKGSNSTDNTFGFTTAGVTLNVPEILGANAISFSGSVGINNDNGATNGMILNVPTGSSNGFNFDVNGSSIAQLTAAGVLSTLSDMTPTGNIVPNSLLLPAPAATPAASSVWIQNDAGATKGMAFNVPTSSTNGFQFEVNHVAKASISNAGLISTGSQVKAQCLTDCSGRTFVLPFYSDQTGATSGVVHGFMFNTSFALSGTCAAGAFCTFTSPATLALTNDAQMPSNLLSCGVTGDGGANGASADVLWSIDYTNFAGSSILFKALNVSSSGISGVSLFVHGFCVGS